MIGREKAKDEGRGKAETHIDGGWCVCFERQLDNRLVNSRRGASASRAVY